MIERATGSVSAVFLSVGLLLLMALVGCGATKPVPAPAEPVSKDKIRILELEAKAQKLVQTSERLTKMQGKADELRRRLTAVCVDVPRHDACQEQTAAEYARRAFCEDDSFTRHIDEVVNACHQGACKQVDEARLLKRSDYMRLVQRLPHSLVLFGGARTRLDARDKKQLQQFLDQLHAEGGYLIIVGRASRDGSWRKNLGYALGRAESTRSFIVNQLGYDAQRVGYITYGHEKMYLTQLDADRLAARKLSVKRANRSALVFAYPCYNNRKRP